MYAAHAGHSPFPIVNIDGVSDAGLKTLAGNVSWHCPQ